MKIDRNPHPKPYDFTGTIGIGIYAKRETRPTMNAHEFINFELELHLNDPYIPTK